MRSFVIIEVEHGETTDPLDELLSNVRGAVESGAFDTEDTEVQLTDWSVRVDLPPYMTATSLQTHGLPAQG